MDDRTLLIFGLYAFLGAGLTWSLFNGAVNGWLAGETYRYTMDDNPTAFAVTFLVRVALIGFAVAGCAHTLGYGPDPVQAIKALAPWREEPGGGYSLEIRVPAMGGQPGS